VWLLTVPLHYECLAVHAPKLCALTFICTPHDETQNTLFQGMQLIVCAWECPYHQEKEDIGLTPHYHNVPNLWFTPYLSPGFNNDYTCWRSGKWRLFDQSPTSPQKRAKFIVKVGIIKRISNLHCGDFTAALRRFSLRSSTAEISLLGFHRL
jgi:hypothetical protein